MLIIKIGREANFRITLVIYNLASRICTLRICKQKMHYKTHRTIFHNINDCRCIFVIDAHAKLNSCSDVIKMRKLNIGPA